MIQILRDAFKVNERSVCLAETNSISIEVYDCYDCLPSEQRSYIKTKQEDPVHFILNNPNAETLCFAALDNCLLNTGDPARCDFLIGNTRKLYFVEIKNTIVSQRRAARTNAINQLDNAISILKKTTSLTKTELIAVICLKAKQVYPLQSATRGAETVKFKLLHNATLMEGQSATF